MTDDTTIPPVIPGIFTLPPYDRSPPELLGGYCEHCDRYYFPRPQYCRSCLGAVRERGVGAEGIVYAYTVVRRKPPLGLPLPYSVGFVDLEGSGLRVFCLLDPAAIDRLRVGLPVRLAVGSLGHDGTGSPCLRPYFTPKNKGDNSKKREA